MDSNAIIAIIGSAILAFLIRFFNVILEWLAQVLNVHPPEPIPIAAEKRSSVDRSGPGVVETQSEAPDLNE